MVKIIDWKSDYNQSIMVMSMFYAMATMFIVLYYFVPDIRGFFVIPILLIAGTSFIFVARIEKKREYLTILFQDLSVDKYGSLRKLITQTLHKSLQFFDQNTLKKENVKLEFSGGSSIEWDLPDSKIKVYLNLYQPRLKRYRVYIYPNETNDVDSIKKHIHKNIEESITQFVWG
jgi:hypothetical protein